MRGEVVDSRSQLGWGDPHYYVTVECHERAGAFSRLTFEVTQDDWMRFRAVGREVCVQSFLRSYRLARCD